MNHIIDLEKHIPADDPIQFLRAEIPKSFWTPLVLIRYSVKGVEPKYGLRLDLGKQAFIDHLEDEVQDKLLQKAAPRIVEFLSTTMSQATVKNGKGHTIDLTDSVPGHHSIALLRAEIPASRRVPLVLIRYAIDGVESKYGLRLDLGKQAFIDHLEDDEQDEFLKKVVPTIVKVLESNAPLS